MSEIDDLINMTPQERRNWWTRKPRHESQTAMRLCLNCRNDFRSSWAGERICQGCRVLQSRHDALGLGRQSEGRS